jgi:hypothetical protein
MSKNPGRPKKPEAERKTNILRICLTPTERRIVEAAAQAEHSDTSTWARAVILRAAEKKA